MGYRKDYDPASNVDQPRYEHDCDKCVFLATYGRFDLYFCTHVRSRKPPIALVKTRHGDLCSSFPAIAVLRTHTELMRDARPEINPYYGCTPNSALAVAVDHAMEAGLFVP